MAYPRWLARINRRVFNPIEVRRGKRPVVVHVGRRSGVTYLTPVDAHPTRHGYVLVVRYGPESDWVRNILSAGGAVLRIDGAEHRLTAPALVGQEAAVGELPTDYAAGRDFFRAADYLVLRHPS